MLGRRFTCLAIFFLVYSGFIPLSFAIPSSPVQAAAKLIEALGKSREKALQPFSASDRFNWNFLPGERKGVEFKSLDRHQKKLASNFLMSTLSSEGNSRIRNIFFLETILFEKEKNPRRDPLKYFLAFFGNPTEKLWGWRLEGHHLSLNFTHKNGKYISTTPAFFGSNPDPVGAGAWKGFSVLGKEGDLGRELLGRLSSAQRERAIISEDAKKHFLSRRGEHLAPPKFQGLPYKDLNKKQRKMLKNLAERFINNFRPDVTKHIWGPIAERLQKSYFGWAGSDETGKPHYYRIHGPRILIEYDNSRKGANHVHTVWRDPQNDFGDLLLDHLKKYHKNP